MWASSHKLRCKRFGVLVVGVILAGLMPLIGCSDDSSSSAGRKTVWVPTETSTKHAQERSITADELVTSAASPESQFKARRACAFAAHELPTVLRAGDQSPWRAQALTQSVDLACHTGTPIDSIRALLADTAIVTDPFAMGVLRNNLGCAILSQSAVGDAVDAVDPAIIESALAEFEGVCQVPEAPLNEAACHLWLARLRPLEADAHIRLAQAALNRLDADELSCPMRAGQFLGVVGAGERLAFVLDSSQSMVGPPLDGLKSAAKQAIHRLLPSSAFMVSFFGDDATVMPIPSGANVDRGMLIRGSFSPERDASMVACDEWITRHSASGDTYPLNALRAVAAAKPTQVFLFTDGLIDDDTGEVARIADEFASMHARIDVIILANEKLAKAGWSVEDIVRVPRYLASRTGGVVRLIGEAGSTGNVSSAWLSGFSIRNAAERDGMWTPAVARQYAVLVASVNLWKHTLDPSWKLPATTAEGCTSALRSLVPDPVTSDAGPSRQDWQLLMIEGAARCSLGDPAAWKSFDEAAEILAALALSAAEIGESATEDHYSELCARAVLLSALAKPERFQAASANAALKRLDLLHIKHGCWSVQLLESVNSWFPSRCTRSLKPDHLPDALALQEFAAIHRIVFGGEPASPADMSGAPIADRVVFKFAQDRSASLAQTP
jgi:hypothetical protein